MKEYILGFENDLLNPGTGATVLKPTVKEELIRCKYCMYWDEVLNNCDKTKRMALGTNGFCSRAERRTTE